MSAITEPSFVGPALAERGTALSPLHRVVPRDPFAGVRLVLISVYAVVYMYRFFTVGLIIDRITVAMSVFIFLACAFVGRPWRRWGWLLVEVALYAAMWWSYEVTRTSGRTTTHRWLGIDFKFDIIVTSWRDVDRFLFFGHDPAVVLQRHFYDRDYVHWYDKVASSLYFSHFILPVIAMAAVWVVSQYQWRRFMKRFATLLAVSCIMFVVLPSAPPWMTASRYHEMPAMARPTAVGFFDMGFKRVVNSYGIAKDWGNPIAAMPSLHSAFSLIVPAFFLPWIKPKWLKALVMLFPLAMLTALVYFGEHWVIDGLVGWAIVGASFWLWARIERRGRVRRAWRARAALPDGRPRLDDLGLAAADGEPA